MLSPCSAIQALNYREAEIASFGSVVSPSLSFSVFFLAAKALISKCVPVYFSAFATSV